jgi:hypothetical protein
MKFNLVVDIEEYQIEEAMADNVLTREEAINRITNNFYMGLSCIDVMLNRDLGIDGTESFVERI